MDVAQKLGLGFLAFWNGSPRSLGNEVDSGNRNRLPGNNCFPDAEAFYMCAGGSITDSMHMSEIRRSKAFTNNVSTVPLQGDKTFPVVCSLKMLYLNCDECNIC